MDLVVKYKGEENVLEVQEEDVITFPDGLVGFGDWRRFVLLEDPDEAPVAVLQSVDDLNVSLLVTDPFYVTARYSIELPTEDKELLGLARVEQGKVLCVLALKEGPVAVTANLLGPIVINPDTRTARQVILQNSHYSAQHPVLMVGGKK